MARRVKGVDKVLRNLQRVAEGIPAGAIKGVEDVAVANQERILVDLDRREGLRRQLARRLVPGSAAEPTLRDVAERLGPELQAACREREERLRGLCAEVQARNAHSQTLLQQAAAYNQVLLDALLGRPGEAVTYTPSGEKASACGAAYDGTRAVDWHA